MTQMIIPFFIVYQGCPNRCIYCNLHKTAGNFSERITEDTFRRTVHKYLNHPKRKGNGAEIAFYGGNFTGMAKDYQSELLGFASPFIEKELVHGVRISARPDSINKESLDLMKRFGVTTVEIGAQSMVDEVLNLSNRGHGASDVSAAMEMLKERGFKTGIHLMAGLPGDSQSGFRYTIGEIIALKPDMVRIHPTVVLQDTGLAELFLDGTYLPLSMPEAIDMCKYALRRFGEANIAVIRVGLQTTREMEMTGSIIAGPYHPAFRSLVEESIFFDMASAMLADRMISEQEVIFSLSPKDVSFFLGQKNKNMHVLKEIFGLTKIDISVDPVQERGTLAMIVDGSKSMTERFRN
ncbi:MAG: radical SAM protein [Syntrophales bacterium]|jgi:histone acetyltransferase (RNA polymerase elongator complex component)